MSKFCKKCGNQLKDTSKFCSKCGAPYADEPNTQEKANLADNNLQHSVATSTVHSQQGFSVSSNESSESKGSWSKYVKWGAIIGIVLFVFTEFFGTGFNENKAVDNSNKTATSVVANSKETTIENNAENTLINFHKAITDKEYRKAYNLLSHDMQKYVGDYDKFINGYGTTLSSSVTNMQVVSSDNNSSKIEYVLEAKDKLKAGIIIQHFRGTAILKKTNGEWKIDEVSAKKIDEVIEDEGVLQAKKYPSLIDGAGVLSANDKQRLLSFTKNIEAKHNINCAIMTVKTIPEMSMKQYTEAIQDKYFSGAPNGSILLVLNNGEKKWHITTDSKMRKIITDDTINGSLKNAFISELQRGNYEKAFLAYLEKVDQLLAR